MIKIKPFKDRTVECSLSVPGSKSYTHRALIGAALCENPCTLKGMLKSHDTSITCEALKKLGVSIFDMGEHIVVNGTGGTFKPYPHPIYLGSSGTSMRLLAGLVTLGRGTYTLVGSDRMHMRPILSLANSINRLGVPLHFLQNYGFPPIQIVSCKPSVNIVEVDCSVSSQYLSTLLFIAPCFKDGLNISVIGDMVSRPYIDMTISVMNDFGISVKRNGYTLFSVSGMQSYNIDSYSVESDCSHACYFWAAAAITGGCITVKEIKRESKQGDINFLECMEKMGCFVKADQNGVMVRGGILTGINVNMSDMPDVVPTLAVVAAFARGTTVMTGISHLKVKESNRIVAILNGLKRMGILVETDGKKLMIKGGNPTGALIDTYDDHRIAMSFALAGLRISGVKIMNERCVSKSFPEFWKTLGVLYV